MFIRYLLKSLLLPPLSQLVLLFAALIVRNRFPRAARLLFIFGVTSLWAFSTPVIAIWLAHSLENYPALETGQLHSLQADAIVILGGGQNNSSPEFGQPVSDNFQLARIRYGAYLAKQTGLPVLVTGGTVFGHDRRSGAATMAFDLENGFGVKPAWQETASRTTAENGSLSYRILSAEGKKTVLLVTNAMHMMRSTYSFEQAGFTVIPAPTMFVDRQPITLLSFLPSAGSLELSSRALHEWLGYWIYTLIPQT